MNLCITVDTRAKLVKSTQELLYEQDTGLPPHHSTHLGRYEGEAEELVDTFIDELNALTPTLTY